MSLHPNGASHSLARPAAKAAAHCSCKPTGEVAADGEDIYSDDPECAWHGVSLKARLRRHLSDLRQMQRGIEQAIEELP